MVTKLPKLKVIYMFSEFSMTLAPDAVGCLQEHGKSFYRNPVA